MIKKILIFLIIIVGIIAFFVIGVRFREGREPSVPDPTQEHAHPSDTAPHEHD